MPFRKSGRQLSSTATYFAMISSRGKLRWIGAYALKDIWVHMSGRSMQHHTKTLKCALQSCAALQPAHQTSLLALLREI